MARSHCCLTKIKIIENLQICSSIWLKYYTCINCVISQKYKLFTTMSNNLTSNTLAITDPTKNKKGTKQVEWTRRVNHIKLICKQLKWYSREITKNQSLHYAPQIRFRPQKGKFKIDARNRTKTKTRAVGQRRGGKDKNFEPLRVQKSQ